MTSPGATVERGSGWFLDPTSRHFLFLLLCAFPAAVLRDPASSLAALSLRDERYQHVVLIPVISTVLICLRRGRIFQAVRCLPGIGLPVFFVGPVLWLAGAQLPLDPTSRLSLAVLALVVSWLGAFLLCYGAAAFRAAFFPLLFLLLFIPLPVPVVDWIVRALQQSSAAVSALLFRLIGMPFLRHGLLFSLPGVDIRIEEQCSGIRSSISLLLSSLLAAHVLLRETWKKACLALVVFPVVLVKNALRIVIMSWLGVYVDARFFYGNLHRYGGLLFSAVGLALVAAAIVVLRRGWTKSSVIS
jgi:exosortase